MARRKKRANGLLQKSFRVKIKGVSKQFVVYGRTEAELSEKEAAKRAEIERGTDRCENPSLNQFFERWSESRNGTVKESTARTQQKYFGIMARITLSYGVAFGDIKLKEIDTEAIREVQKELRKNHTTQTTNDYIALLKHIFSDAMKERIIDFNPCCPLNNLKRTEEAARDTKHRALSIEETKAFFDCERCKKSYYYNVFRFAINTGLRSGEIGALKYSDITKDGIKIERTITRTETGGYTVGESAKTKAGRRTIPFNDQIRSIIQEQKEINNMLDGNVLSLDSLLFKAPERDLLMATPIDREIKTICKAAGLEPFTMHAFRATFATRCIESGMKPRTLQELLGHTNYNLTMSLYGHCLEDTKKSELERVVIAL